MITETAIDWWECSCGNNPGSDGFYPCLEDGFLTEPDERWGGALYICYRCGDIIEQSSLEVVGRASEMVLRENHNWFSRSH